jgi:hypothetical protein
LEDFRPASNFGTPLPAVQARKSVKIDVDEVVQRLTTFMFIFSIFLLVVQTFLKIIPLQWKPRKMKTY